MNETLLLDTDVASFLFKNSPHAKPFNGSDFRETSFVPHQANQSAIF